MHFSGCAHTISEPLAARMRGVSWHPTLPGGFVCPALEELRLLTVSHWDFAGEQRHGELIVAAAVAGQVLGVFETIFRERFPIARLRLIDEYGGDDELSMRDNNSSGFNCRLIAGTTRPSGHALGLAIDLNPVQNPYIVRGEVHPENAQEYVDRTRVRPGMLTPSDPIVSAFASIGWSWGGAWDEPKDYHHFERSER